MAFSLYNFHDLKKLPKADAILVCLDEFSKKRGYVPLAAYLSPETLEIVKNDTRLVNIKLIPDQIRQDYEIGFIIQGGIFS